jgi:hypothetical protein
VKKIHACLFIANIERTVTEHFMNLSYLVSIKYFDVPAIKSVILKTSLVQDPKFSGIKGSSSCSIYHA